MYPSMLKGPGDLFADFSRLQERLDELLGDIREPSSIRAVARQGAFPVLKVGSGQEATEIYAFAPGLDPAKLEVSVDKGLLTITGERASELPQASEKVNIYASERFSGAFRRVISLPEDADPNQVHATCRDGIVRVSVAKRESAKPRQIAVN